MATDVALPGIVAVVLPALPVPPLRRRATAGHTDGRDASSVDDFADSTPQSAIDYLTFARQSSAKARQR